MFTQRWEERQHFMKPKDNLKTEESSERAKTADPQTQYVVGGYKNGNSQ